MFSKLFKNKAPTTAQVDTQLSKLADQEADHNSRFQAIDALLIEAWGDPDIDAATLKNEQREISDELQRLVSVRAALMAQRQQAALREIAATFEDQVKAISSATAELQTNTPQLEQARRVYLDLQAKDQRLRSQINIGQIALGDNLTERAESEGINRSDLSTALTEIRSRYPLLAVWIADSSAAARELQMGYPKAQEQS